LLLLRCCVAKPFLQVITETSEIAACEQATEIVQSL